MLLVTYNDALQSKPAKYERLYLTPDDKYSIQLRPATENIFILRDLD